MNSPKETFELRYGKKESAVNPDVWETFWLFFFEGWIEGCDYQKEISELEKDNRTLSDFQRGVG
jgi:hypothetical protein